MRKRRILIDGSTYHVTSRINDKKNVFASKLGQKVMIIILERAKAKYGFILHNFCIMPNHFHLLITPAKGTNLSRIIQWIKTMSAKMWNKIHGSTDHLWGERFFSRPIEDMKDFSNTFSYIDQNPVKAGLVDNPAEWKACGAYYILYNLQNLVDYSPYARMAYVKLLTYKGS